MTMSRPSLRSPATAFVILALAGGVAITESADHSGKSAGREAAQIVYQSQLRSCVRGNVLRRQINELQNGDRVEKEALVEFIQAAHAARVAAYKKSHLAADKQAVVDYGRLIVRVTTKVHFKKVSITNCNVAILKP